MYAVWFRFALYNGSVMKKRKISKHCLIQVLCLVCAFIACVVVYFFGISSNVKEDILFDVQNGKTVSAVANQMQQDGLINSRLLFKIAVRVNGGQIQTGNYDIHTGASVWRIARMMSKGDVATVTVVIPEGLTVRQIKELLLQTSTLRGAVECGKGTDLPVCDLHDGDLFPDTYRVARGTSRLAVLDLMRKKMDDIHTNWEKAGRILPEPLKNWNEIVTLASIVQKETPKQSEMPIVASVYLNRLRQNMRLQADPTVVYALTNKLGDMRGAPLLRENLKIDSPYNTYVHYGLPPAPIANVGIDAIYAVLQPADTNYLFFVADGQGGHNFAKSYEEHLKNHADWRAIKKNRNKK